MSLPWSLSFGKYVGEQYLEEGYVLPAWYGVAWRCIYTNRAYCLPIPLNKIAGSFRNWWIALRRPCEDDPILDAYRYGRSQGFEAGCKYGELRTARLVKQWLKE